MANNPVTDEKRLVEFVPVQSFWGIFNRVYKAEDGFSLELFRGRTYLGSILSNDISINTRNRFQRFGLRNNDTILRINLGYRTLDVKCQLAMRDGWVRPYEGTVKIAVNNPYNFALQYQQGTDPVALARMAIEDAIKKYALRVNHDTINDDTLRYEARIALSRGAYVSYGLHVVEVLASNIYLDPRRAEMRAIEQQGLVDETRIHVDADNTMTRTQRDLQIQNFRDANERDARRLDNTFRRDEDVMQRQHERDQDVLQGEHGRGQDVLQRQHERQQAFLDAVSEGLKQNLLRDISDGVPPEILVRRYPQFAPQLGFPSGTTALPGGSPQQPLLSNTPGATPTSPTDAVTGSYTIIPQPSTPTSVPSSTSPGSTGPQPFYNTRIGAWLVYRPLSDRERQTWGVSNQIAFMVYQVDANSIAEKGYMTFGDLVIEVNDQEVQSAKILINALDNAQSGKQLSIRVLRNGQPYDLELDMN